MLSAHELAALRVAHREALPETATIRRMTEASDGMGGRRKMPATLSVELPCRLAPLGQSAQERIIAERLTGVTAYVATLPAESDVQMEDELEIRGHTLRVIAILGSSFETARRVACMEMI